MVKKAKPNVVPATIPSKINHERKKLKKILNADLTRNENPTLTHVSSYHKYLQKP